MTPAEFHEGWRAALEEYLRSGIQQETARWASKGSSCCSSAWQPLFAWLECDLLATAKNCKLAIIEHHWQTRFYQHLSPVFGLVHMIFMGWSQLCNDDDDDHLMMDSTDQRKWLSDWAQADLARSGKIAMEGLSTAFDWLMEQNAEHPNPLIDNIASVQHTMRDKLRFLLMPPGSVQRDTATLDPRIYNTVGKAWHQFAGLGTGFCQLAQGHGHDQAILKVTRLLRLAGARCAAIRTASKDMAAAMSTAWALIWRLHVTPDVPYLHEGERPGVRWHQVDAWHILQQQLYAMANLKYIKPVSRQMCWRPKCRRQNGTPCTCRTMFGVSKPH